MAILFLPRRFASYIAVSATRSSEAESTSSPSVCGSIEATPIEQVKGHSVPYCRDQRTDALGKCQRRDLRGPRGHHSELIATPSRADIRLAQLGANDARQVAEGVVAGAVAIPVVDAFETVEVDEQQRERFAISSRPCEFPVQSVEQAHARSRGQ